MTARQRAALKKAQAASARKRRGKGKARPKSSRRRRALKYAAIAGAVGAAGYAGAKGHSINKRKRKAIHDAKVIQKRARVEYANAKKKAKADPNNKRAKTLVKVHRRKLRIASTRSVHKAIIKQHTGR